MRRTRAYARWPRSGPAGGLLAVALLCLGLAGAWAQEQGEGGRPGPTADQTPNPTPTPTPNPTPTPTPNPTPTPTPNPTPTPMPAPLPTPTLTPKPMLAPLPTLVPLPTPTPTPSLSSWRSQLPSGQRSWPPSPAQHPGPDPNPRLVRTPDAPGPSDLTVPSLLPGLLPVPSPPPAPGMPAGPAPDMAPGPVSPIIYPAQDIPLRFSHARHQRLPQAPDCVACHTAAASARSSLDNLMPAERACRACHAIDRALPDRTAPAREEPAGAPPTQCTACHPGYRAGDRVVARVRVPPPNLHFNHQAHAARGIDCVRCHGDMTNVDLATRAHLPRMDQCLECHDGRRAPRTCTTCHLADAGGYVRTAFAGGVLAPSGTLRGDAHGPGFRTAHAAAAQNSTDYCGSCHRKSFCVDCHQGAAKPMDFHGGDYLALHAAEARRNQPDCSTCHRLQTFCTGCHSRSGVSADGRGSEFAGTDDDTLRFHPPGWAHEREARHNLSQCASCHREQFCVGCHTAEPGRGGASPHPPGWASSRRCRSLLARNPRVCLRCHVTPDQARCGP